MRAGFTATGTALWLALAAGGCGNSMPVRYYALEAPSAIIRSTHETRISVGPLTLPEAIDRPQMVLRVGTNQLVIDDGHRWSAPLKRDIPRVLAAQLARRLPDTQFVAVSQQAALDADFRLLLDIQRFDSILGDAAEIEILWTLKSKDREILGSGEISVRETMAEPSHAALAAAHSRALARIAERLEPALRQIKRTMHP